jgi:hypothetical protein
MDHDDWRVIISFPAPTQARRAKGLLARATMADDARREPGPWITLGTGSSEVFLYTKTGFAACGVEHAAREALARNHLCAQYAIQHWLPREEQWEELESSQLEPWLSASQSITGS